jgi:hypothetical protein
MNKSGNGIRRPEASGVVKLPKVSAIGNNNISNPSMKAILESGMLKRMNEGAITSGSK